MSQQEYVPIEAVTLEHGDRRFRYHFDDLTVQQVTMVEEIANFKAEQVNKGAKTFQSVIESGGAEWFWKALSWLLREVGPDGLKPVNIVQVENAEDFVRELPAKYMPTLRGIVDDFFSQTGRSGLQSALSQRQLNLIGRNAHLTEVLSLLAKNAAAK